MWLEMSIEFVNKLVGLGMALRTWKCMVRVAEGHSHDNWLCLHAVSIFSLLAVLISSS